MTIRDLLSSFRASCPVRMMIFDRDFNTKELKVCFDPGETFKWIYEDDMEELEQIADCMIVEWYVHAGDLRIHIFEKF